MFDIQTLYIPSVNHLEAIEYNEISKEDTYRRYSLLKRTDLQAEFSKVVIKPSSREKEADIDGKGQTNRQAPASMNT